MFMLALLLQATPVAAMVPSDIRGKELVDLFESMCVEHGGASAFVHQLDRFPPQMGRRMTAQELVDFEPSGAATEGWIIKSPHDGYAGVWLAPSRRTCGMTVREADPAGMKQWLEASFRKFYATIGATVSVARPDEQTVVGGANVETSSWLIDVAGHQMTIIASLGDKPSGNRQHLMTFTVLH